MSKEGRQKVKEYNNREEIEHENCYGCVDLRQFGKKEQEESMEVWRKAKKSGALRSLADTNPHIAECMCDKNGRRDYMTGATIVRMHNCKDYKLGEKSKEEVFEGFKETGYYNTPFLISMDTFQYP